MPALAGVVSLHPETLRPLPAMTAALRPQVQPDAGYARADAVHVAFAACAAQDGRHALAFDGEVHNSAALARELGLREGSSDAEVVLAAHLRWGPAAPHRLDGGWAFALFDAQEQTLFCSRDPWGLRPFHYHWNGSTFVFASELRALLAHTDLPCRAHLGTVAAYVLGAPPGDQTFYEGLRRLASGHQLTLYLKGRRPTLHEERWFEPPSPRLDASSPDRFRELLQASVALRLRPGEKAGVAAAGLAAAGLAALGSRALGAPTRTLPVAKVAPGDLARDLPAFLATHDEPVALDAYEDYRLLRAAREAGLETALDDAGAADLLGGDRSGGALLAELARGQGLGAALREARALSRQAGQGMLSLLAASARVRLAWAGRVLSGSTEVLSVSVLAPALARHVEAPPPPPPRSGLADERRASLLQHLPALLRTRDAHARHFGLTLRSPFLDRGLVSHALALRAEDLIKGGRTQAVLREALRGVVPDQARTAPDPPRPPRPVDALRLWLGPDARVRSLVQARALDSWLRGPDSALAAREQLWRLAALEHWLRRLEGRRH